MSILKTIAVAFSIFSIIPMPQFPWSEKNTRYMFFAFPAVGAVIGLCIYLWCLLCGMLDTSAFFWGTGVTLIPIIVSGGIHLDGYCDTADALSSHASREKKIEILSDPHIGAFGVISLACYLLIYLAIATQITLTPAIALYIAATFVLSRCFSGCSVAKMPSAKSSGMVHDFAELAAKKRVVIFLSTVAIVLFTVLIFFAPIVGGTMLLFAVICYLMWYRMAMKTFGGITGDLAGSLLQKIELAMLLGIFVGQYIMGVI